jgi:hypothetical protein
LPLLLGIVASVRGDSTKLSQLVNTNAILCWQQVQELITNAFSYTGQPVFELIKLHTKVAKENIKYEISFRCRHVDGSSAADIDNTASVLLRKSFASSLASTLTSGFLS